MKNDFSQLSVLKIGLTLTALLVLITGCTVGPDYKEPVMELPQDYTSSTVVDSNEQNWWTFFNDPDLTWLINESTVNNRDIAAAVYQIDASRALRDYTSGQYYPSVDAVGSYQRAQLSKDGQIQTSTTPKATSIYSAGFDFLWEIDLFGRIKRTVESADAYYQATVEDYHDVMVTMLAEVARNYIELRTAQARIAYAENNIATQQKTLELTQNLYQAEIVSELDVRQAEFNLANTKAEIPSLRTAETASLNRLAVLIGQMPGQLKSKLKPYTNLPQLKDVNITLSTDLLRQRPDIRRAERQLASQTARIGIATADLYPSLQLSGYFQIQSRTFSGLGNINNKAYSFGPGIGWNIFDGNRIKNVIKSEEAATNELLAVWQNTVLLAVEDVNNAMSSYTNEQMRTQSLDDSVKASLRSVEIVESLYTNGLTDFQNVLDTQRSLFVQQDKLASSEGQRLTDIVRIYKSFGIGWNNIPEIKNESQQ